MGKEYLSTPQFPPIFSILTLLEIVTQCYRIFIDFFPFLHIIKVGISLLF
mgnify:CR=1 FL=1